MINVWLCAWAEEGCARAVYTNSHLYYTAFDTVGVSFVRCGLHPQNNSQAAHADQSLAKLEHCMSSQGAVAQLVKCW